MRSLHVLFILLYFFYCFELGISSCLPEMLLCYFIGLQSLRWPPLPPIPQFKLLSCDHITQWQLLVTEARPQLLSIFKKRRVHALRGLHCDKLAKITPEWNVSNSMHCDLCKGSTMVFWTPMKLGVCELWHSILNGSALSLGYLN